MIRKINSDDLDMIYSLGTKYDDKFKNHYNLESYLNKEIYILLCYEEDHCIKGFLIAIKLQESVEILLIYVDNNFRKKGIATKMLEYLEKYNTKEILLEVAVNNKVAIDLYNKMGYNTIYSRKGYYNGIDADVMKKVLS